MPKTLILLRAFTNKTSNTTVLLRALTMIVIVNMSMMMTPVMIIEMIIIIIPIIVMAMVIVITMIIIMETGVEYFS